MDKRKVITAYRRGFLTLQECAQVLGMERNQLDRMLDDGFKESSKHDYVLPNNGRPING